jgi:hypothetical protein
MPTATDDTSPATMASGSRPRDAREYEHHSEHQPPIASHTVTDLDLYRMATSQDLANIS